MSRRDLGINVAPPSHPFSPTLEAPQCWPAVMVPIVPEHRDASSVRPKSAALLTNTSGSSPAESPFQYTSQLMCPLTPAPSRATTPRNYLGASGGVPTPLQFQDDASSRRLESMVAEVRCNLDHRFEEHARWLENVLVTKVDRCLAELEQLSKNASPCNTVFAARHSSRVIASETFSSQDVDCAKSRFCSRTRGSGENASDRMSSRIYREGSMAVECSTEQCEDEMDSASVGETDGKLEQQVEDHLATKKRQQNSKPKGRSPGAGKSSDDEIWVDGDGCLLNSYRVYCGFVQSDTFDYIMGVFILLNTLFLGLQVDITARQLEADALVASTDNAIRTIETVFCCVFFVELLMRLSVWRCRFFCALWNIFDLLLVASASLEELIKYGVGGDTLAGNFAVFRMMKIVKVMRSFKVIRVIRAFRELRVIVMSMVSCAKSIFWTLILLLVLLFIVSVLILVELNDNGAAFSHTNGGMVRRKFFPNLGRSLITLFMATTGGVPWFEASNALEEVIPWINAIWITYIAIVAYAITNTITGIFVDQAIKISLEDTRNMQEEEAGRRNVMMAEFRGKAFAADVEGTGMLDRSAIDKICKSPDINRVMKEFDIELTDVRVFFDLVAGPSRRIFLADIDEFTRKMFRLKGVAKNLEVVSMAYRLRVHTRAQHVETQLLLADILAKLQEQGGVLSELKGSDLGAQPETAGQDLGQAHNDQALGDNVSVSTSLACRAMAATPLQ